MKTKILLLMLIVTSMINLNAQNHPKLNKDQIIAKKWEFIMERTRMNTVEVSKVQPLFVAYENEVWLLFEKNKDIFKTFRKIRSGESVNFEEINNSLVNFEIEKAQLQKKYYLKLKKVVSAATINKLLLAERFYRKDLIMGEPQHRSGRDVKKGEQPAN
jgi:hypothetical protein